MPTIHYHNLKPKAKSSFTVRRLIGLRTPSDRIASAVGDNYQETALLYNHAKTMYISFAHASYIAMPHCFSCSKSMSAKPACFSVTERLWSLR